MNKKKLINYLAIIGVAIIIQGCTIEIKCSPNKEPVYVGVPASGYNPNSSGNSGNSQVYNCNIPGVPAGVVPESVRTVGNVTYVTLPKKTNN